MSYPIPVYNNRGKKKAAIEGPGTAPTRCNPDVELAILRQLPTSNFPNIIYQVLIP